MARHLLIILLYLNESVENDPQTWGKRIRQCTTDTGPKEKEPIAFFKLNPSTLPLTTLQTKCNQNLQIQL